MCSIITYSLLFGYHTFERGLLVLLLLRYYFPSQHYDHHSMDLETQPQAPPLTASEATNEDETATTTFSRFVQKRRSFGSTTLLETKDTTTTTTDNDDDLPILGRMTELDMEEADDDDDEDHGSAGGVFLQDEDTSDVDSVASSPFQIKAPTTTTATPEEEQEPLPTLVATTFTSSDDEREPSDAPPSPHKVRNNNSAANSLADSDEEEQEWNLESDEENEELVSNLETNKTREVADEKNDVEPKKKSVEPTSDDDDEEEESMEMDEPSNNPEEDSANDIAMDETTTTTTDEPLKEKTSAEETAAPEDEPKKLPDRQSLISSTDQLFLQVNDKEKVTVKDILQSLQVEYDCKKFDKESKAVVRERLTDLILGKAQPLEQTDQEEEEEEESSSSEEEEVSESEASGAEADGDDSDFEGARKKVVRKKKTPSKKKSSKRAATPSSDRKNRVKRKSAAAIKAAAVRVQADLLRKKRLEELRVRNEELQLIQNQQEQTRAAQIAAKLETDTEEIRMIRLEQRLDLLQKLDKKRFAAMQDMVKVEEEKKPAPVEEKAIEEESDEEEESSDDEMELEFVGNKPTRPLVSLQPDALSLLSWADKGIRAPASKKDTAKATSKAATSDATTDEFLSLLNQTKQTRASPGQSMNARAFLKTRLLSRQRRMGNQWLARELGYQNEKEHVEDCLKVESQKRIVMLKKEEERIQANEREMLRERWIKAEDEPQLPDDDEDPDDEDYKEPGEDDQNDQVLIDDDEEEDEELAIARELGQTEGAPKDDAESTAGLVETSVSEVSRDSVTNIPPGDEKEMLPPPTRLVSADNSQEDKVGEMDDSTNETTVASKVAKDSDNAEAQMSISAHTPEFETQPPVTSGDDSAPPEFETQLPVSTGDDASETPEFETQPPPADTDPVDESDSIEEEEPEKPKGPRNSAWREMLKREAEKVKKMKKRNGEMIDDEADEEEEEEIVGLEDFGFAMHKKKKAGDNDENEDDELDEDDLENVVDDVSDGEGDEDAGEEARKALHMREEKERHQEIMRRMREGYDGRRGGIAGGGAGARGVHRFDQLVAADNRDDAKRLGLLNDDELDSDEEKEDKPDDDEEDDEGALLDKMLKDRFLHRSSVEMEENFSEDEGEDDDNVGTGGAGENDEDLEEKEQERMAKRFTKRARMQRLIEAHGDDEEFSQMKLIEEDTTLKEELQKIKVSEVGGFDDLYFFQRI